MVSYTLKDITKISRLINETKLKRRYIITDALIRSSIYN
jgi:hypothetical protein